RELPVHLEGLGKEYGHFTALKSLDLTVPEGTALGFLGPNGAGKSTTIKIMTNLIRPSRGRAVLFGIEVRQEPTRALARIGAVIEAPEFYGYLSPLEAPTAGLDPRGMAEVRDVIKSLTGEGRTIFMSSHLPGEVQEVCDDVALLNHGELLVHGSVRDLSRGADTSTFQTTFLRPPTS